MTATFCLVRVKPNYDDGRGKFALLFLGETVIVDALWHLILPTCACCFAHHTSLSPTCDLTRDRNAAAGPMFSTNSLSLRFQHFFPRKLSFFTWIYSLNYKIMFVRTRSLSNAMTFFEMSYFAPKHTEVGTLNLREWTMQEWTNQHYMARVDIAGVDISARCGKGGLCRSWQCGTKWQGWTLREWTMQEWSNRQYG